MPRKMTALEKAASDGDRLALLRELQVQLVESFQQAECVRDREPLARRIAALGAEVDELAGQQEPIGPVEEILARRRARAAASGPPSVRRDGRLHG